MIRTLLAIVVALVSSISASAFAQDDPTVGPLQATVTRDPRAAELVFRDVENFLRARAAAEGEVSLEEALQREYFDRASPGLRMYMAKYGLTLERLLRAIESEPADYDRIPENLVALRARADAFRATYAKLSRTLPGAVFPPTYFLVAEHHGRSSGSIEGPLISVEHHTPTTIEHDLPATLVHEMVHMQQLNAVGERYFEIFSGPGRSLLALSIREGAATFFAEVVAGGSPFKNEARRYLEAHEEATWSRFESMMLGPETGDFLWSQPEDPEQPRDVGYAIGARIVETFYEQQEDKVKAAEVILGITDYPAFLALSGYPKTR